MPAQPQPRAGQSSRHRRQRIKAIYIAAGAIAGAFIFALALVVAQLGDPPREPGGGSASTGAPAAEASPSSSSSAGNGAACGPQRLVAPGAGTWRTATQRGDIQLRRQGESTRLLFRVYRSGAADDAATLSAEVLTPSEVETRVGLQPPAGADAALVITFSDEFRAAGDRFELGRVGSVSSVVVSSQPSGLVAVAGVEAAACFELRAPDWERAPSSQSAEIFVDIRD